MSGLVKLRSLLFKNQIQKYQKRKKMVLGFILIAIANGFILVNSIEAEYLLVDEADPIGFSLITLLLISPPVLSFYGIYFLYINSKRKKIQIQFMIELVKSDEVQLFTQLMTY